MNGRFISGLCFGGVSDNFSAKSTLQSANNSVSNSPAYVAHFRGATALVTGGADFIGSNIVGALLAAGAQVRMLDDLSTGDRRNLGGAAKIDASKQSGAELIVGSVNDIAAA